MIVARRKSTFIETSWNQRIFSKSLCLRTRVHYYIDFWFLPQVLNIVCANFYSDWLGVSRAEPGWSTCCQLPTQGAGHLRLGHSICWNVLDPGLEVGLLGESLGLHCLAAASRSVMRVGTADRLCCSTLRCAWEPKWCRTAKLDCSISQQVWVM